jgi:hypothetical protein
VLRGFYGYYPVKKAKETATTVARFKDDTSTDKSQPPYLVVQPNYGKGRVIWLGSGETWRLRQYREVWHERFWTKLVRYAGAGSIGLTNRRITPSLGPRYPAGGFIEAEAQFFNKDLQPLSSDAKPRPRVHIEPLEGAVPDLKPDYEMVPKPGSEDGRFIARILVKTPGKYRVEFKLDDGGEVTYSQKTEVFETDPEWDNAQPDPAAAYDLASDAADVLARIDDPSKQAELKRALQRFKPPEKPGEKGAAAGKDSLHLVFDLHSAALIPDCMKSNPSKQTSRGKVEDVWDQGLPLTDIFLWTARVLFAAAGLLLLVMLIMLAMGRSVWGMLVGVIVLPVLAVAAAVASYALANGLPLATLLYWVAGGLGLITAGFLVATFVLLAMGKPVQTALLALLVAAVFAVGAAVGGHYLPGATPPMFSITLGLIVGLLSIEWLTRKLLRLA